MKKLFTAIIAIAFILPVGCKKTDDSGKEVTLAKKYARYKVAVYKDIELKTWLATLARAEDVSLLDEEKRTGKKGTVTDISKVRLADDSVGYIDSRHLADAPVVFTAETKAYVRPTTGSTVFAVIPKGELGFIVGEKGLWVQVYIGDIDGKHVTQQWVEGGFSNDPNLVLEAKEYTAALEALKDKDPVKSAQAKTDLGKLAEGNSVIAELAKEKLGLNSGNQTGIFHEENTGDSE